MQAWGLSDPIEQWKGMLKLIEAKSLAQAIQQLEVTWLEDRLLVDQLSEVQD